MNVILGRFLLPLRNGFSVGNHLSRAAFNRFQLPIQLIVREIFWAVELSLHTNSLSLSLLLFLSLIICERTLYQHISHWGVYIFRASWRTQAPSRTILNCIINLIHTKCVIECECKCSWIHKAHMVFIGNIHHGKGYDMRIGEIENDWEWERKLGPARTVVHTNKKKKKWMR